MEKVFRLQTRSGLRHLAKDGEHQPHRRSASGIEEVSGEDPPSLLQSSRVTEDLRGLFLFLSKGVL